MPDITLITDFGTADATVAIMKAIFLTCIPSVRFHDIMHNLVPYHIGAASYMMKLNMEIWPPGTFHVVFADVYETATPGIVMCDYNGSYLFAPNNGIISLVLGGQQKGFNITKPDTRADLPAFVQLIAETIANIHSKKILTEQMEAIELRKAPKKYSAYYENGTLYGDVMYVDTHGNVITNISDELFQKYAKPNNFRIEFMKTEIITTLDENNSDVAAGKRICFFNRAGYLEISIRHGNAEKLLGLRMNGENDIIIKLT